MSERDYTYLPNHRASIGMHTEDAGEGKKKLTFALAFCNRRDQFSRRTARNILDGRLNHRLGGDDTRLTFETIYEGDKPRNDIFFPVVDTIRDRLNDGFLALHRDHIDIVTTAHAIAGTVASTRSLVSL
jgi:hypothetical protein